MKTEVIINGTDRYNSFNDKDTGYIDGYVKGGDDRPYAVVVLDKDDSVVMVEIYRLRKIGFLKE